MKVTNFYPPRSSFLSVEKDMSLIVENILSNERLKRLLYYTTPDALDKPNLTTEQSYELMNNNIKIVPKLQIDGEVLNYIIISFDSFTESYNPEFRDNIIEFDIICHFDQWKLKDFALRPYKIAAEIDTMFNYKKFTGIGDIEFLGANQLLLTDEFAGICLIYKTYHGEEDKKYNLNPADDVQQTIDFNDFLNK